MRVILISKKLLVIVSIILVCIYIRIFLTSAPVVAPKSKTVCIVIDDLGGYAKGIREMMSLPFPVTFAVLPFAEFSKAQATEAVKKGYEIIVHMPFEASHAKPVWYGNKYINRNLSDSEIQQIINEAFSILPMAKGMNNHMGSLATGDKQIMQVVLNEIRQRNLFYLDSRTTEETQAPTLVEHYKLPYLQRDVFLDDQGSPDWMKKQFKLLLETADDKGMAVGIGHVGPSGITLANVLREEVPKCQKNGYRFVFLSEYAEYNKVVINGVNPTIGIDPGHGGIDSGTKYGNFMEKHINLSFSKKLAQELRKNSFEVVFTREEDQLLTPFATFQYKNLPYKRDDLKRRGKKLENAGASVILSIHTNWSELPNRQGAVVFYPVDSGFSRQLAENIQAELNQIQLYRKVAKPGNYYLFQQVHQPIVLIELGYLSNKSERELIQKGWYQKKLESAIVQGLIKTLNGQNVNSN